LSRCFDILLKYVVISDYWLVTVIANSLILALTVVEQGPPEDPLPPLGIFEAPIFLKALLKKRAHIICDNLNNLDILK